MRASSVWSSTLPSTKLLGTAVVRQNLEADARPLSVQHQAEEMVVDHSLIPPPEVDKLSSQTMR